MLERIVDFSARNRFLVIILAAAAVFGAVYCLCNIPLDAVPDLSDTQVIIYSKWDRSPDIIEDQVTYPIVTSLLGAPKVKAIRGLSDFGFSYVYVIFEDGTDIYWARSRVLEYLNKTISKLPQGVTTEIGPDATSVGWVFQYALVDKTGKHGASELRSFQDWNLKYHIQSVKGVAEVATIGGYQKQYQVNVDPGALAAYNVPLSGVVEAVKSGNSDSGGRLIEISGAEYMIRGRGYAKSAEDIGNIAVKSVNGTAVLVKNVAKVTEGPDIRRGASDLNGEGDAVSGIVIMRQGENALNVINSVKAKLAEVRSSLPEGVEIVTVYDRSELIKRAIATLRSQLFEEMLIVSLVILLFLWHFPSALVPIITIPVSSLLAFIPMYFMGITSNIMSLAGIAISIGVLVDGAIIEVENAYKRLELWEHGGRIGDPHEIRIKALKEVIPSVFFSLLVIAVAFLPVFTLVDQEGRLFRPLAYTKTLAMAIAALLALTLDPAIRLLFMRMDKFTFRPAWAAKTANSLLVGTYHKEERHPVSRLLFRLYRPVCEFSLRHSKAVILSAVILMLATVPVFMRLGSEFMPPLNEGTVLYMPTTLPGISVTEAKKLLQAQDKLLKEIPEVESVFGKIGRAETSTDPAPFSMMETVIVLKPDNEWRKKERWYSALPAVFQAPFRHIWRDRISYDKLIEEMDNKLNIPGVTNAWTMPIKARIDMLSTGIRTPIGVKILGRDLKVIEGIGLDIEKALSDVKGTRSVLAERVFGGYYLDVKFDRSKLASHGISMDSAQMSVLSAIGGETVTQTIEGRERYSVSVRYPREYRDDREKLSRILVDTPSGARIPLSEVADISLSSGPSMIRDENGLLTGYVYVDLQGTDAGSYVERAKAAVSGQVKVPEGYSLIWSGQFENMQRVRERLKIVIPLALFLIILLLYANTKSPVKTLMVMLAVPFSMVGAVWALYLLGYNLSIAVWVGMIALLGLDAETGVFMLLFLDLSYNSMKEKGGLRNEEDLKAAVIHGAVKRIRPKAMTVTAILLGLLPIMWSFGAGADVLKRIAAPMIGGVITSFALELLIYPSLYFIWKKKSLIRQGH